MVVAHQSNLTEIAAGKAAQQKATSQKVRDLGQMFITDHTANDAKLRSAAKTLGVTLPGSPNAQQRAALARFGQVRRRVRLRLDRQPDHRAPADARRDGHRDRQRVRRDAS